MTSKATAIPEFQGLKHAVLLCDLYSEVYQGFWLLLNCNHTQTFQILSVASEYLTVSMRVYNMQVKKKQTNKKTIFLRKKSDIWDSVMRKRNSKFKQSILDCIVESNLTVQTYLLH